MLNEPTPHSDSRLPVLIMGIGNLVLQDEGFGVHAIQRMAQEEWPEGIDLLDGGTAGLHLLGYLQRYEYLVVIDAALDSNPVGTVRRLKPQFAEIPPLVTAHEIGLKDVLEAMAILGYCPQVELVVASVERYTSLGLEMSRAVEDALPQACQMAREAALQALRRCQEADVSVE